MKARVKATGEFIEVIPSIHSKGSYDGNDGYTYTEESLIMLENEPDYWERLKHQYAGMAMQGMLSNRAYLENFVRYSVEGDSLARVVSTNAIDYATVLVDKLKEEEK